MNPAADLAVSGDAQYTGPIGLLIVALIGIATVLLIVNMNRRIKRLPPSFPDRPPGQDDAPPTDREP